MHAPFKFTHVLCPIFRSLINVELIFFIWYKLGLQIHSFTCAYTVFPTPFVEKAILSSLSGFGTPVKYQLSMDTLFYFWTLSFVPLIFDYSYSGTILSWLLLLCNEFWNQDCFGYSGSFAISYEFWISSSVSTKKLAGFFFLLI
jgi:hypothetical protein